MMLERPIKIERVIDEKMTTSDTRYVIWTGITDSKMDYDEPIAPLPRRPLSYSSENVVITELDPSLLFPFGERIGRGRNSVRVFMVRKLKNER